jgi:hypothetical protein
VSDHPPINSPDPLINEEASYDITITSGSAVNCDRNREDNNNGNNSDSTKANN